ncbi:MAG: hypothetical protein IT285_14945 [Bdellovibrionales bacterium]|nr:hypothetical protein [Bdellovibrionales bacterium]
MSNDQLLKRIKRKAAQERKNLRDPRFLDVMGFLVAKGFLSTNLAVTLLPNKRLRVEDAIWVGTHVEPRVLEVLPAAVLRLGRHFDLDVERHRELWGAVELLRKRAQTGVAFLGVPYEKYKIWVDLPLRDGRTKAHSQKKVVRTFRLDPGALERLAKLSRENRCTATETLERLLLEA